MFGIAWDFADARDKEMREDERIRRLLSESAPAFRDAVVAGFTDSPENMRGVATDATLDQLIANALSLRLGDDRFAQEVYEDIRDQAVRTPERWYDVEVKVRLSSGDRDHRADVSRLGILVSWEYTVVPSRSVQRFACTGDLDEFHELVTDVPGTSTWLMTPRPGFDPSDPSSFELLAFSVDGEERPVRRLQRKSGQTYSVSIGDDIVREQRPVRVRHTYRTIADPANHRLFLAIAQPARGVSVQVDYSSADISRMSVTDMVPTSRRPYVSQLPAQADGRELTIDIPGWIQAGTGFTFVWTLAAEETSRSPAPHRGPSTPVA
ncbi:hypothetical protein K8Z61_11615 [Nocardioides sp. TRM66260-LWL]|uniref:hypothetical protein n=1 Tax=Nocardioides sp. TRM66260-LWL TaxID=2874478 RepID=UPI001CC5E73F|nr:hypothetical protein [Nocardioides sp. TRM66260-LWL]MBZ5735142.1 hypothetical protein [Nocardioides sp. TRM66260-LWL]